jgi:two-component system sensor histidine kinase KdpD
VSERARRPRWPLVLLFVLAATTALLIGAALASTDGEGPAARLLVLTVVSFIAFVAVGAVWASSVRSRRDEVTAERAETAARIAGALRGPLASLSGLADAGLRAADSMSEDERRAFFTLMDEEASRLALTTEQIATALAIDAGRLEYDLREDDLGTIVQEAVSRAPHGQHPLTVHVEPDLTVPVDRPRIDETLANLIDNAAKYSPPDAPIEVRVFLDDRDGAVVEIADHGPGIPSGRRDEVFSTFCSWRPPGYEETPGTGLGLFIARAHVLAHGGRITIEEQEDEDPASEDPASEEDEGDGGVGSPALGTIVRISLPSPIE